MGGFVPLLLCSLPFLVVVSAHEWMISMVDRQPPRRCSSGCCCSWFCKDTPLEEDRAAVNRAEIRNSIRYYRGDGLSEYVYSKSPVVGMGRVYKAVTAELWEEREFDESVKISDVVYVEEKHEIISVEDRSMVYYWTNDTEKGKAWTREEPSATKRCQRELADINKYRYSSIEYFVESSNEQLTHLTWFCPATLECADWECAERIDCERTKLDDFLFPLDAFIVFFTAVWWFITKNFLYFYIPWKLYDNHYRSMGWDTTQSGPHQFFDFFLQAFDEAAKFLHLSVRTPEVKEKQEETSPKAEES